MPLQCSATPETTLPLQSVSIAPHGASPGSANSASPTPRVWLTHVSIAAVDTASSTAFARLGNTRGSMSGRIVGISDVGHIGRGAPAGAAGSGWRPGIWLTTRAQPRALRPPLTALELQGLYRSGFICLSVFDTLCDMFPLLMHHCEMKSASVSRNSHCRSALVLALDLELWHLLSMPQTRTLQ